MNPKTQDHPTLIPIHVQYGNAYLIKGRRAILVDCGNPGEAELVAQTIRRHGIEPESLALLLITHAHLDHYGSAAELRAVAGVKTAVHRLDAAAVRRGGNAPLCAKGMTGRLAKIIAEREGGVEEIAFEPDILLDGETSLEPYGVSGRVIETPGHTEGSVSVLLPGGEALVGDLLVGALSRRQPHLGLIPLDAEKIRRSIRKALEAGAKTFFGAHGGPYRAETVERILRRREPE